MGKEEACFLSEDTIRFINKESGYLFSWDKGGPTESTCPLGVEGADKNFNVCTAKSRKPCSR